MNSNYEALLALTRLGVNHPVYLTFQDIKWETVKGIADKQGLSAIVLDGIEKLPDYLKPPKGFLLEWIGETFQDYECRYNQYRKAIAELARFYNSNGYKMMLLKGYACGLNWSRPDHRPCGDIDIWLFGKQKEADVALSKEMGVIIDSSHHHHTVFYWRGFMVENHYDFINVHHHRSNTEVEVVLKELAKDDDHAVDVYGEKVYIPSANLHALFMLKHNMMHFAAEGITLRQLLDWGFYVEMHHQEIDWPWFTKKLDQFGMTTMFNIFNAICVDDLGFNASVFHQVQYSPFVKDKVLKEILSPEFGNELPKKNLSRLVFKYRRWQGNAWKQNLCYTDSRWSAFWSGVWSHLLKPSSI